MDRPLVPLVLLVLSFPPLLPFLLSGLLFRDLYSNPLARIDLIVLFLLLQGHQPACSVDKGADSSVGIP